MLTRVENSNKYKTADNYYYHLRSNGKDYLFSESQLAIASQRADKNKEDIPIFREKVSNAALISFGVLTGIVAAWILNITFVYIKMNWW